MTKKCSRCKLSKESMDFGKRKNGKLSSWCKACLRHYQQTSGRDNHRLSSRKYSLQKLYGLTLKTWDELFESQGRCCVICKSKEPRGGRWTVDHDHWLGHVRGILCVHCNAMLGLAEDDENLLKAALWYLERQRISY